MVKPYSVTKYNAQNSTASRTTVFLFFSQTTFFVPYKLLHFSMKETANLFPKYKINRGKDRGIYNYPYSIIPKD